MTVENVKIERDSRIQFHAKGTLTAVTRWITGHDVGIAEWLKNVRRAYQSDRLDVEDKHRVAVIMLKDADADAAAKIGVLDVGGVRASDLERWSEWQNPDASKPSGRTDEEETQGNGGKAYMYRLFTGLARITGVADGLRSSKGFFGSPGTVERGTPGWLPTVVEGRDAQAGPWKKELEMLLAPFNIEIDDLPSPVKTALASRKRFTVVEGADPVDVFHGRIDADSLIDKVARHEQSTLVLEQLKVFAIHNGDQMNSGRALQLEDIEPFPGFEIPKVVQIPSDLSLGNQTVASASGQKPLGRLTLRTSKDNMYRSHARLRPRWKVSYRAGAQMIGAKVVSELLPSTPGSQHVYAVIECDALAPDYVTHGRARPNDGPLVQAIDEFAGSEIRALAAEIAAQSKSDFDEKEMDEVLRENRMLDRWKDQFLPDDLLGDGGTSGKGRGGGRKPPKGLRGLTPHVVEINQYPNGLALGVGVEISLEQFLNPRVLDDLGRSVSGTRLRYKSTNARILQVDPKTGQAVGRSEGVCDVFVQVDGHSLASEMTTTACVAVDHVLLTTRSLQVARGGRRKIDTEVTDINGQRRTDVLLNWRHDAADQLVVRIRADGIVTGNRLGRTQVFAGAGPADKGVWARVPASVEVIESDKHDGRGSGRPRLLITGRDRDPDTGTTREGDPEQPVLWQETSDEQHNIWWLNLEAPEARFAFAQRNDSAEIWRLLHASKLVAMVTQVKMKAQYTEKPENERDGRWATYKQSLENFEIEVSEPMWESLKSYVVRGGDIE